MPYCRTLRQAAADPGIIVTNWEKNSSVVQEFQGGINFVVGGINIKKTKNLTSSNNNC